MQSRQKLILPLVGKFEELEFPNILMTVLDRASPLTSDLRSITHRPQLCRTTMSLNWLRLDPFILVWAFDR